MMVTDSVGDAAEHTASYTNAVRTMRALTETADPMNLVATVEERFMSFGGDGHGDARQLHGGNGHPRFKEC